MRNTRTLLSRGKRIGKGRNDGNIRGKRKDRLKPPQKHGFRSGYE